MVSLTRRVMSLLVCLAMLLGLGIAVQADVFDPARDLLADGDLDGALTAVRETLAVDDDPFVRREAVYLLLDLGLEKHALAAAEQGLSAHPSDAGLLESRAAALAAMDRDGEAAESLRRAWEAGGSSTGWTALPYFSEKRTREPYRALLDGDALASGLGILEDAALRDRLLLLSEIMEPLWIPQVVDSMMRTGDNEVFRRGMAALGSLGTSAAGAYERLLAHGEAGLRRMVLREIWRRPEPAYLDFLEAHLSREAAPGNRDLTEVLITLIRSEELPSAERIALLESVSDDNRYVHLAWHALADALEEAGEPWRAAEVADRLRGYRSAPSRAESGDSFLEAYWECMERQDIREILEILEHHRKVRRMDARVFGLPENDFDDQQNLTIAERLFLRAWAREKGLSWPTEGEMQYPREIRHTLREIAKNTGMVPDCSGHLANLDGDPLTEAMEEDGAEIKLYNDTGSDNEVNIIVNPYDQRYILATSNAYSSSGIETYRSSDWGDTWTHGSVPGSGACDPVSYYNSSETLYHCWLDGGIRMAYSANHGSSWTTCTSLESSGMDRQDIYIENFEGDGGQWSASPCLNKIYVGYHSGGQQILKVSAGSSHPYCNSWSSRVNLSGYGSGSTIGTAITSSIGKGTGSGRGTLLYIFSRYSSPSGIYVSTSTNCGGSLSTPALISSTYAGVFEFGIPCACSRKEYIYPQADSDRQPLSDFRNNVYVVWNDLSSNCSPPGCTGNTTCNSDVYVAVGTPNNRDNPTSWTWSTTNLTRNVVGSDLYTDEFYPSLSVDQADGSVYVSYYRSESGAGGNITARQKQVHYVALRTTDGGNSWEDAYRVTDQASNEYDSGANSSMQWGDYTWNDAVNGVLYPCWTDRREAADEDIWSSKVCSEPAHWSERGTSPSTPATTAVPGATQQINVSWTAPDLYWGDGGEDDSQRKYQLYVDGSLHQDNIPWTTTSTTYSASNCTTQHSFRIRAVNQCGVTKDYGTAYATATCGTTYSISGHVETNGGSSMQGVTVTATGGHSVLTDGSGNYTISGLGNGSYTVAASYSGYTFSPTSYAVTVSGSNVTGRDFTGTEQPKPPILFVDDDAGKTYDTYFTNALSALGETFDTVTVASGANGPSAATLGDYEIVIWNTGYDYSATLTATDESSIASYLSGGGKLFFSSQDYLYDRGSESTFETNTLHLSGYTNDSKASSVAGVSGDPIGNGVSYTASFPSGFTDYADTLVPGSGATAVLNKSGTSDCAATRYSNATYRLVFFATPFEAIPTGADPNNRTAVMDRVLDWLRDVGGVYSISGKVLDSGYNGESGVTVNLSGAGSGSTTTAADGSYTFTGLSDGSYTVTPSKGGCTFTPASKSVTISGGSQTGQNFLANCGATTYSISGTVSGDVQSGVTVNLTGAASDSTTTNASGYYEFTGLSDGSYTVTPSLSGYTFSPTSRSVPISGGNQTAQNFTATENTYTISGTVSGDVQSGVSVVLTGDASDSTTTNVSGFYSFTVPNGSYTVTPSLSGYTFSPTSRNVTVSGANQTGQNFTATLNTYTISGTVSGDVQSGVSVVLTGDASDSTTTNVSGYYSFTVANGSYTVTPSLSGYTFSPTSRNVTVSGGNETGNDFTATAAGGCVDRTATYDGTYGCPACTVTGRSCDAPATLLNCRGATGEPNEPNTLDGCDDGDSGTCHSDESIEGITIAATDGVSCLAPGVEVQVTLNTYCFGTSDYVTLFYATNASSPSWTKVGSTQQAPGSNYRTFNWTFTLGGSGGTYQAIRGQVTYSNDPGTEACYSGSYNDRDDLVFLTEAGGSTYTISGTVSGDVQSGVTVNLTGAATDSTTTNGSGFYEFTGLSDGSYTVTPSLSGYTFSPTSRNVTVSGSNQTGQNFTATAAGGGLDCTGAVTLSDNSPYTSTTVGGNSNVSTYSCSSWNESGPEKVHTVTTGAVGDIVATLSGLGADMDVFILSACDEDACLAYGNDSATASSQAAGTYYIVVDGYDGASGAYTLTVDFESGGGSCGEETATYDASYSCPSCMTNGISCFSGTLLDGVRLSESGAPNTIDGTCADGSSASNSYEYIQDIKVETSDATCINAGDEVKVTTYFNVDDLANDYVDLYYTNNADAATPTWTLVGSILADDYWTTTGIKGIIFTFNLDAVTGNHAVRSIIRWQSTQATCSTGSYDDHDDLVFAVTGAKSTLTSEPNTGRIR